MNNGIRAYKFYLKNTIFLTFLTLILMTKVEGQVRFNEVFNEPNGSTSGVSAEGIGWNALCGGCLGTFDVQGGQLVGNNTKAVTTFRTNPIDISGCSTVTIRMQYSGTPYGPSGAFLDSATKCSCAGNPSTPNAVGCDNCWDFFIGNLLFNNSPSEQFEFIGTNYTPTTASIDYISACIGNSSSVQIEVNTQTWASDEFMRMDNVMLICNPGTGSVSISNPDSNFPNYCAGGQLNLTANGGAGTYEWKDPAGNVVGNSANLSTIVSTNFVNPQKYTVVYTDAGGCSSTGSKNIIVSPSPTANLMASSLSLCEGDQVVLTETGVGPKWSWNGPAVGAPLNAKNWTINNLKLSDAGTYSVVVSDAGTCTSSAQVNITVSQNQPYTMPFLDTLCVNSSILDLGNMVDGKTGNWFGPGVATNMFNPNIGQGKYMLSFDPTTVGCFSTQATEINVVNPPASFPILSPIEECGAGMALFDLGSTENTINGGTGNVVEWFSDIGLSNSIPNKYLSASTTVYAIVTNGSCSSNAQSVNLILSDGPEITMNDTIVACQEYILESIVGNNLSGNQAYYSQPNGMGVKYNANADLFSKDTVVYIYDFSGTCFDEQKLTILIGEKVDAGSDLNIELCTNENLDLNDLKDPNAGNGIFLYPNGDTIQNGILNTFGLGGATTIISFNVDGEKNCLDDNASFTINFSDLIPAGKDTLVTVCIGDDYDLSNFVSGGGMNGFYYNEGNSTPISPLVTYNIGDTSSVANFLYVTETGSGCPKDTALLIVNAFNTDTILVDGIYCRDYEIDVNGTKYNLLNPSGIETDPNGPLCGGVSKIDLKFYDPSITIINRVLCPGQSITVNNVIYDENNLIGTVLMIGGSQNGCDSTILVSISYDTEIINLIDDSYCSGDSIIINGVTYNENNTSGSSSFITSSGCDSIVMVALTFNNATDTLINPILCPDENLIVNGEIFDINNSFGNVIIQGGNRFGCDSILTIDIQYDLSFTKMINDALCVGNSIQVNGTIYDANNSSGLEVKANANGCDSVYLIDLQILKLDTLKIKDVFCSDTTIVVGGTNYDRLNPIGEEIILGGSSNGCNQLVMIDLTFSNNDLIEINDSLCVDEFLIVNGIRYDIDNQNGQEIMMNSKGCDSIVTINLFFQGFDIDIEPVLKSCEANGEGNLYINVKSGGEGLINILLDGVSVIAEYLQNDTLFKISEGVHEIIFEDLLGCNFTKSFLIENNNENELKITSAIVEGEGYQLGFEFDGQVQSVLWSNSNADNLSCTICENPIATPQTNEIYYLNIKDLNGCTFSDSINLDYIFIDIYYGPNVFSPNEDGVNDIFYIDTKENIPFKDFQIFDRWGNRVFNQMNGLTGDPNYGWDGRKNNSAIQSGVFIFFMVLDLPNGTETISGEFSLIR